jgi:hypothetical protein
MKIENSLKKSKMQMLAKIFQKAYMMLPVKNANTTRTLLTRTNNTFVHFVCVALLLSKFIIFLWRGRLMYQCTREQTLYYALMYKLKSVFHLICIELQNVNYV